MIVIVAGRVKSPLLAVNIGWQDCGDGGASAVMTAAGPYKGVIVTGTAPAVISLPARSLK